MAAPMAISPASLLAIKILKCDHSAEQQVMKNVLHSCTAAELFDELHGPTNPKLYTTKYEATTSLGQGATFWQIDATTRVGDLVGQFGVKVIRVGCTLLPKGTLVSTLEKVSGEATSKTVNAFEVLMMGGQSLPSKKTSSSGVQSGVNRKDELFNDVIDMCEKMGTKFSKDTCDSDGRYFVQALSNALWYITNQMDTLNEASRQQKDVNPVPELFYNFCGYNETKRKKQKSQPMSSSGLRSNAECLFSLLNKPYLSSTVGNWPELRSNIEALASCLSSYEQYLNTQSNTSAKNKDQPHPCRTVDQNASVYHCSKSALCVVKDKYKLLDKAVTSVGIGNPVLFDEDLHIDKPFENTMQKFRFFDNLQLTVSVDVIKYCPGGGVGTTFIISQAPENRSEPQMMTDAARLVQRMRGSLKEFHTRSQKKQFKRKVSNIAKVQPSLLDYMYSELALDASAFENPDMQQRLHVMSLGESGLVNDLRHLNPGRPNNRYDLFFEKLGELVEDNSAAEERRHGSGVAHLSRWISLSDMIKETVSVCPEGTPVPSKSLVRLQFAPRNQYASTALTFTSRIPVQYKIQRRQLRAQHVDDHYCAALFKYLKHRSIELKTDGVLFCADDKAKVPIGEPDRPVSTGVRGRQSIAPVDIELSSLDHDMKMTSLTPSVVLQCSVRETVHQSFVRGQVTTFVNDTVTQASSPFRHAAHIVKILESNQQTNPKILLKYTDGGTDQRNTLEQVKCANICLFQELNLDMLITVRCAPGQSYVNPAERIMSILNYGLQNVATERQKLDEETEKKLNRCNGMSSVRELLKKEPGLEPKWVESIEPIQSLIEHRFTRLTLKDEPIRCLTPVSDAEIDLLKRHLRGLFPGLDIHKLQKVHTNRCAEYVDWKTRHCRETQYTFQVRKCSDATCCLPKQLEEDKLMWLPEPELDETREHFLKYEEAKQKETTEKDRPSLQVQKIKKTTNQPRPAIRQEHSNEPRPGTSTETRPGTSTETRPGISTETRPDSTPVTEEPVEINQRVDVPLSTQNARAIATCIECRKPRVVYSKTKLSQRKEVLLATCLSDYEYSCGAPLFPPSAPSTLKSSVVIRPFLQCVSPIELCYYGADLGRKDLCTYCADLESETDAELKKMYKTVLPICQKCRDMKKEPIVQRKYGKSK